MNEKSAQTPAAGTDRGPLLTTEQAARVLQKSPERIKQLCRLGYIPRAANRGTSWTFHLLDVVQGYIRFRDAGAQRAEAAQTSRVADARAREIELKIAETEARLIDRDEAVETTALMLKLLRDVLSEVPAKSTRDPKMQRMLRSMLDDMLDEVAAIAGQRLGSDMARSHEGLQGATAEFGPSASAAFAADPSVP